MIQPFEIGIVSRDPCSRRTTSQQRRHVDRTGSRRSIESDRNHAQADLRRRTTGNRPVEGRAGGRRGSRRRHFIRHPTPLRPKSTCSGTILIRQTAEYRAKIEALDRQREQKQAERDTIQATIGKLSAIVPIVQQRVDIRKTSSDQEYTSKFQYLEMHATAGRAAAGIDRPAKPAAGDQASIAALAEVQNQAVAEFHRTLFGQLAEAERKADGLRLRHGQERAENQCAISDGADRRHGSATCDPYRRRRRHACSGFARGCAR